MKKLFIAIVALMFSVAAFAAPHAAIKSILPGTYTGTVTKAVGKFASDMGKSITMVVKFEGDKLVVSAKYPDATMEIWNVSEKTLADGTKGLVLDQRAVELDAKGAVKKELETPYNAVYNEKDNYYHIYCDKNTKKCDNDVDSRNYWGLSFKNNELTYTLYGVDKTEKDKPEVKAQERWTMVGKLAK